jgi:hypothetical protein
MSRSAPIRNFLFARCRRLVAAGLIAATAAFAPPMLRADTPEANLQARLDAGEFSAAVADAAKLDGVRRDVTLGEIAAAQLRHGAEQAALATLADVRSDSVRRSILAQMYGPSQGMSASGTEPTVSPAGGMGGGVQPDFESLIELISSTIAPETWREAGGTQGELKQHDSGVMVDARGAMKPVVDAAETARLGALRREAAQLSADAHGARRRSALRKVSLTRLDRELQLRRAQGRPIDEELAMLAGLEKIRYVFVYPETGEIVIAGPAGDWYRGRENRMLSVETDRPVLLLDDLAVLMRREFDSGVPFGCSIDPTKEGLNALQAFATESAKRPLAPGTRPKWTAQLGEKLGPQNIRIYGIDPASHAAAVLVEADYRMKLVGIGREEGTLDVPDYFELAKASKNRNFAALSLLRWWFTVEYDALLTTDKRDVYELRGQGVRLEGENEFLAAGGARVATGKADEFNQEFADRFTKHFEMLAQKYPIYAELQNVFDLALVAAVLKNDGVAQRCGWEANGLRDPAIFDVERRNVPATVDSVVNSTELTPTTIMAAAAGGVSVDLRSLARGESMEIDDRGALVKVRGSAASPEDLRPRGWWWD